MNEKKLIPNIRFKGFQEEWKKTRIKNIVQYSSSSFSISELKENNEGNTYPVYDATGTKYYSKKFDMHDDYIAIIKDGSNVGKTRLLPAKTSVLSTMGYLKALNSDILFDFYSITNTNFDKYKVGSGIPHIYFSDYKKECKLIPKISEQQKIGTFFAKLDRLLDLQQQKLDQLELLKKALLQKLFPKQDAKIPELRFKGFKEKWEQEQFSDLYKKRSEKNDLTFGPDRIISVANMYFKQTETRSDEKYMKTYNVFRLGDIAFEGHKSKRFSFGRFVENTIGDGIVSHVFEVFRPITSYDLNYWKYAIHNEDFMGPILRRSTIKATMMNNLIEKDFLKQKITVPKLSEQQKIGNLLAKVDRLIELENKKFSNLKLVKKSLLQNMFVE